MSPRTLTCDLGSYEEFIIRDVFANAQNGETQRELLIETWTAKKTLELAINIQLVIQTLW